MECLEIFVNEFEAADALLLRSIIFGLRRPLRSSWTCPPDAFIRVVKSDATRASLPPNYQQRDCSTTSLVAKNFEPVLTLTPVSWWAIVRSRLCCTNVRSLQLTMVPSIFFVQYRPCDLAVHPLISTNSALMHVVRVPSALVTSLNRHGRVIFFALQR